jgi:Domain of unknown function (DUF5134)
VTMSTPSWLYYLFGTTMLAVAAYCLTLLVLSVATRRPAGRDVEISHLFMGLAMAGMFVARWVFGRSAVWEIIFSLLMVWFLVAAIQSVERYGLHLPHALIHAVMNFTMVLMYWFPMGASSRGGAMSASAGGARLDPGLAYLLALTLCASAIFTLASPVKGRSHFGSHAPAYALGGPAADDGRGGRPDSASSSLVAIDDVVAAPWLVDVSHAVMCVAMAFMLVLLS